MQDEDPKPLEVLEEFDDNTSFSFMSKYSVIKFRLGEELTISGKILLLDQHKNTRK
jgi:hypothetical protein